MLNQFASVALSSCSNPKKNLRNCMYPRVFLLYELKRMGGTPHKTSVHPPGIEPGSPAWQAEILPLDHACWSFLISLLYSDMVSIIIDDNPLAG